MTSSMPWLRKPAVAFKMKEQKMSTPTVAHRLFQKTFSTKSPAGHVV